MALTLNGGPPVAPNNDAETNNCPPRTSLQTPVSTIHFLLVVFPRVVSVNAILRAVMRSDNAGIVPFPFCHSVTGVGLTTSRDNQIGTSHRANKY